MKRLFIFSLLCLAHMGSFAQVIPAERTVNWKLAGIRNSIRVPQHIIDFVSAGGVSDGKTANDQVFSDVLKSIGSDSAIIYFPKGIFYFTNPLSLQSNLVLHGFSSDSTTLLFKLKNEDHLIKAIGSESAINSNISGSLYKDSSVITVENASLFSAGDYIKISEDDAALITSSWAARSTGQIIKISEIKDNVMYLASPLRRSYNSGKARIVKLNMLSGIGIENINVERQDSTIGQTSNISFQYAADCHVKCIESGWCNFAHIELNNCTNIEVSGSYMHHAFNYGDGGKGYGVVAHLCTGECLIRNNIFDSLRHAMLVQAGANGNVFAYNFSKNGVWAESGFPKDATGDIVLHGNYVYANLFEGNVVGNIIIDNSHGKNGPDNTFFRNRAVLYGIILSDKAGDNQNFVGNEITNSGFFMGSFSLAGIGHYEYGNNQWGSLIPLGTDKLSDASLYLSAPPEYYKANTAWPPIGPPNALNTFNIQPEDFYKKGFLTECSYKAPVADTTHKDTSKMDTTHNDTTKAAIFSERIQNTPVIVYPNPTTGDVSVNLLENSLNSVKEIIVVSSLGKELFRTEYNNHISLNQWPDGIYFLRIRLSNNTLNTIKVIKKGN